MTLGSPEGTDPIVDADEPRLYTLEEASQILRDQVCAEKGHQLTVETDATWTPMALTCQVCRRQGKVVDW